MAATLALLVNPATGKGRHVLRIPQVVATLEAAGYAVTTMRGASAAESAALAHKAVAEEYDVLVTMGGDGIAHLALQALGGSRTRLGLISVGTGNDLARGLGIPHGDPVAAARVVTGGRTRRIDLAVAGSERFGTVLASGFDSAVNERANARSWPRGQLRYTLATLGELRVFRPLPYTMTLDGSTVEQEAMLVAVGNTASYGGGIRMCEGAAPDDGLLDVVVITPVTRRELLRVFPRLFRGTHVTHPAYQRHRVRRVRLEAPGCVAYADGERLGPLPVTVEVEPAAAEVFTPTP